MADDAALLDSIDRAHLKQMTMGDASLAREVLSLFDRQASIMMKRMPGADAKAKSEMAHALKGSARGVGAWRVADTAALVEVTGDAIATRELDEAIADVRSDIAQILKEDAPF